MTRTGWDHGDATGSHGASYAVNFQFDLAIEDVPHFFLDMLVLVERLRSLGDVPVDEGHVVGMYKAPGPPV